MLRIHEVTSATDAKGYYGSSVTHGGEPSRQDYYSEGQESIGHYGGKLGETLGLAGKPVDKATFDLLCDNRHPATGKKLTPRTNDFRRVCYDLTFSGPKSWSVVEAFAGDDLRQKMRQAFDEAVAETVAEDIEPDMKARERAGGADHDIPTGNVLTALFPHATARPEDGKPPDPHWHHHLLVWNATLTPDGKIKAGQFGDIVRDKGYYEAAFYARLALKTEALGLRIERRGGKEWEIAGVPQAVIDRFSKRTGRIEAEAKERGITDEADKARLGAKTRSRKQKEMTMPELRKAWDAQLTDGERVALAGVYGLQAASGPEITPAAAVKFAIAHCSEHHSVWPERELKRVALLHGLGCVTPEQIAAELPKQGVMVREMGGRRMATTEALIVEENAIVGLAANGRGSVCPVGVPEGLERGQLNEGQWAAATGLLKSSNRVNVLDGPAGAGKSWSLKTFDEAMRLAGAKVTYLGTTTSSVKDLRKEGGFEAETVAHFLLNDKLQAAASGGRVVIDEISMLGHRDAYRLFEIARQKDLKLILVGDSAQHGAVNRGALMRILKEYAGVTSFRLEEIKRQEDGDYLQAVKLLAAGKTGMGFDCLDRKGWVKEIADSQERYEALASDYLQAVIDKKSALVVSPTHAEASKIAAEIRRQLKAAGKLGSEEKSFTRLVAANASEAERGLATTYRPGDVIQFMQNAKGGYTKGERLTVSDPAAVPVNEAGKFQLYRQEIIQLSTGDRIRFTGPVKTLDGHKLGNGAAHSVAGFTKAGDIRLDNGWLVPADAGHFRAGYVETSFGSQGRTVQRVILGMGADSLPAINQEQLYVSASRARERLTLFTDDKAAIQAGIAKSSHKLAALDLRPGQAKPKPKRWERLKRHLATLRRVASYHAARAAWSASSRPNPNERQVNHGRG
jgi:conjugative relaxase-like TrwC/TraI family protein